ncbi:hypothetical protein JKP88DRAFT_255686, partial [Tribonema minus]
ADTYASVLRHMIYSGRHWAKTHGIPVPTDRLEEDVEGLQAQLQSPMEALRKSGKRIFILCDEVHRFFSADRTMTQPTLDFFKALVSPARSSKVCFIMTGNSMCEAWLRFSLPNGQALPEARHNITIPINQSPVVAGATCALLQRWWADLSDTALPDTLFGTVSQDPTYYCYVALFYDKYRHVEQAFLAAANKMLAEFTEESGALMRFVTGDAERARYLRELVTNEGCQVEPILWLHRDIYQFYFQPYLQKTKEGGFALLPGVDKTTLAFVLRSDGSIPKEVVDKSRDLANGFF